MSKHHQLGGPKLQGKRTATRRRVDSVYSVGNENVLETRTLDVSNIVQ